MSDKTKRTEGWEVAEEAKFAADADEGEQPGERAGDQVVADMMRVMHEANWRRSGS